MTCNIASRQYMAYTHLMALFHDKPFQMRASEDWLKKIDDWRRKQPDIPSRAEAIRRLVEIGLMNHGCRGVRRTRVPSQMHRRYRGRMAARTPLNLHRWAIASRALED